VRVKKASMNRHPFRRTAQRTFLAALNDLHPEVFARVRKRAKALAEGRFGSSKAMTKLLGQVDLDTPWFRLFILRNARLLLVEPTSPCPDIRLLVDGPARSSRRGALNPANPPVEAQLGENWSSFQQRAKEHWKSQRSFFREEGLVAPAPRQLRLHVEWLIRRRVDKWSLLDIAVKYDGRQWRRKDGNLLGDHVRRAVIRVEAHLDLPSEFLEPEEDQQ
jgi:hypothetical protein